jgi:hypothetical protein
MPVNSGKRASFSGLPVADVLILASGDDLVKQPNDIIAREG